MAGSLEGPIAKLVRAEAQYRILEREVRQLWPPNQAWPIRTEKHRGGLEYRFYLGKLPHVEAHWAVAVGEIMFDLRSALDHLAWELHVRRWRGKVPKKVKWPGLKKPIDIEGATQFPIYRTPDGWAANFYRIATLSQRERRALRLLQPYQTRNDKWQLVRDDLSVLNALHNIDKHRQLHVVVGANQAAVLYDYAPEFGFRQTPMWGSVKPHAHIETWTFAKAPPKVQPHHGALLDISLDYAGNEWPLFPTLEGLTTSVAAVLRRFANRFPPSNPPIRSRYTGHWWKGTRGNRGGPRLI